MTTTYEGTPELAERLAAAELVVIGRLEKLVGVELHELEESQQVHSVFSVSVESAVKGEPTADSISVRMIGGSAEGIETASAIKLKEGEQLLLVLSRDYGPGRAPDAYVPYFDGCYRLRDDLVSLPEGRMQLATIRSLVSSQRRAARRDIAVLEELEPARLRRQPYPEVEEVPDPLGRGAYDAAPERSPEPEEPKSRSRRRRKSS